MGAINLLFLPIFQLVSLPHSTSLRPSDNLHISIIARKCTHTVHTH